MINKMSIFKNKTLLAFLLSLCLGSIIIVPNIILGGKGIFTLAADFNYQQIPFNMMINNAFKSGSFLWTWFNDLGSNFISTFSFYNLFSPFNIIGYLFPANWYPYLVGPIFILKYGVAGLTSYLFIKRYVKNRNYAIIGSLLYSFSGFQLTNTLFYHFHDVVAIFPLLLYSLDNLVYDNKRYIFGLIVALSAFTNWFFFIGEVVFVVIYYFVKLITKSYSFKLKKLICIFTESFLGTMLAACILIPTILFTLNNPRIGESWTLLNMFRYKKTIVYLDIIRAFILPSEVMYPRAILADSNYSSVEIYLPLVSCILTFAYLINKPRKWESIAFIILVIFAFVPIFNSSFFIFVSNYYARWFYILTLVMSLMSAKCLDSKIKIKPGIISYLVLCILFLFICFILYMKHNLIILNNYVVLVTIILSIINLIISILLCYLNPKNKTLLIGISIFIFVAFWGNYTIYRYKYNTFKTDDSYVTYLKGSTLLKSLGNSRSTSTLNCPYNLSYINQINNNRSFNSNLNSSLFGFYNSIGIYRNVSTEYDVTDSLLNNYLGIQFIIDCDTNDDLTQYGYTKYKSDEYYSIFKNEEFKNLGFLKNKVISSSVFNVLDNEEKKAYLNDYIIVPDEKFKEYKDTVRADSSLNFMTNEIKELKNGVSINNFYEDDGVAIFAIPYDTGWSATVNGNLKKIDEVDNGMMAIRVNRGDNKIVFKYYPPGLKVGILLSILSAVGYCGYFVLTFFRRNKNLDF